MKRFLSLLLVLVMVFALTACSKGDSNGTSESATLPPLTKATEPPYTGFRVPDPMEHPDYSFGDKLPTIAEMRQMAVKAMEDILSVQWCVEDEKTHSRTVAGKTVVWNYTPEHKTAL